MKCLLSLAAAGIYFLMAKPARADIPPLKLPPPYIQGRKSVEEALLNRRSQRSYRNQGLTLQHLSQLLWAAYGVNAHRRSLGLKTVPSAGALYPIDIYAVIGQNGVAGLAAGVYHFTPETHELTPVTLGDPRNNLARAALGQMWLTQAPVTLVVTGEYARCEIKYGERGRMFTHIESGCVGQNIFLQAESAGLKAGMIGSFNNGDVIAVLNIPPSHDPLLLMPVGYPK